MNWTKHEKSIKHILNIRKFSIFYCLIKNLCKLQVKKTCGTPKLLASLSMEQEAKSSMPHNIKWATPAISEILRFLSTIDKSKGFYSNIVNK